MCGKMETVELLLDKGVNFDLKDSEGRTVLEVLKQYTANQATEIKNKIKGEDFTNSVLYLFLYLPPSLPASLPPSLPHPPPSLPPSLPPSSPSVNMSLLGQSDRELRPTHHLDHILATQGIYLLGHLAAIVAPPAQFPVVPVSPGVHIATCTCTQALGITTPQGHTGHLFTLQCHHL